MENIVYLKYIGAAIMVLVLLSFLFMIFFSMFFTKTFEALDKKMAKWVESESENEK